MKNLLKKAKYNYQNSSKEVRGKSKKAFLSLIPLVLGLMFIAFFESWEKALGMLIFGLGAITAIFLFVLFGMKVEKHIGQDRAAYVVAILLIVAVIALLNFLGR